MGNTNESVTKYKNNSPILGLHEGSCMFTTSDFPVENPRM